MAHAGGRPTKYDPKYCQMLIRFFSGPRTKKVQMKHYDKEGNYRWSDYRLEPMPLPAFVTFAIKIGVDDDTLLNWATAKNEDGTHKYPEFFAAYARAKDLQKRFIIENGLNGSFNPQFAIFVAKNVTDMKDKQEMDHTGNITIIEKVNPPNAGHNS